EVDPWLTRAESVRNPPVLVAVHSASQSVIHRVAQDVAGCATHAAEALVLAPIVHDPGCTPGVIRRRIGLHRSTMSTVLERLQLADLIVRAPVPLDLARLPLS